MGGYSKPKTDVVIDIETATLPVTQEEITAAMAEYSPPSNYKDPEVIARHKANYMATIEKKLKDEKRFSIGGKRMISCALGVADTRKREVRDIMSWASDDLIEITRGMVKYLDQFSDYRLVGWNHTNFDLPEVIKSFIKTGVRPSSKPSKWDVIDLCRTPFYKTSMKDVAAAFELETMDMDGSDVQALYEAKDWDKIREYNEHDVYLTGMIYLAADTLLTF